ALGTEAGYIGLVASIKRAASTFGLLRGRGVTDDDLTRIHAPAGLDLGAVENAEIAVAVLAELVARRAAGQLRTLGATAPERTVAIDPVCGMSVHVEDAKHHVRRDGVDHWFCSAGCKAAFAS